VSEKLSCHHGDTWCICVISYYYEIGRAWIRPERHGIISELRGSVVGWGTMLQARWSLVRVPDEVDFFNLPNPSSRTMALGSTQPVTEMSTGIFLGVKNGRRVGLTTLPPCLKMWEPQPLANLRASMACTGITLAYLPACSTMFRLPDKQMCQRSYRITTATYAEFISFCWLS
jgi:hypothetical protein